MDESYVSVYRDLYEHHWWWRAREELVLALVRSRCPVAGFRRILDIGCGEGLLLEKLSTLGEPEGIEPEAQLARVGQQRGLAIHHRPFDARFRPRGSYGLILLLDVLEHLDDDRAALVRVGELLGPDGLLVLTVPAFPLVWTRHDDLNHHRRRYTRAGLSRMVAASGLRAEVMRYFFHWLLPVKLLARACEALTSGSPRPPTIPRQPVNRALLSVSRTEQWLTSRLGVERLPGSSILLVGRRAT